MTKELSDILAAAYAAKIMGQGDIAAVLARFVAHRGDDGFLEEARAELDRLRAIHAQRCFASNVTADFLSEAIPAAEATPLPAPPTFTTTKEEDMTSKLKGLADIAKSTIAEVEGRAETSMGNLAKAKNHAHSGLDKVDGVTAEIEQAATDMENFANQVTNGPPTE